MKRNPADATVSSPINLSKDGTNCRYNKEPVSRFEIHPVKSMNMNTVKIKNTREINTLIFFRYLDCMNSDFNPVDGKLGQVDRAKSGFMGKLDIRDT